MNFELKRLEGAITILVWGRYGTTKFQNPHPILEMPLLHHHWLEKNNFTEAEICMPLLMQFFYSTWALRVLMTSQANWRKSKRSRNGLRLFRERLLILIHIWKLISWFHEHKNFCPRFFVVFSVAFFEHRGCFLELELILGSQSNNIIMWHWKCACTSILLKLYETTGMLPIKSRFFYFRSKRKTEKNPCNGKWKCNKIST